MNSNKISIFKSPDTVEGKVGVVRSGLGMSNEHNRRKHYDMPSNIDSSLDEIKYREIKRKKVE